MCLNHHHHHLCVATAVVVVIALMLANTDRLKEKRAVRQHAPSTVPVEEQATVKTPPTPNDSYLLRFDAPWRQCRRRARGPWSSPAASPSVRAPLVRSSLVHYRATVREWSVTQAPESRRAGLLSAHVNYDQSSSVPKYVSALCLVLSCSPTKSGGSMSLMQSVLMLQPTEL